MPLTGSLGVSRTLCFPGERAALFSNELRIALRTEVVAPREVAVLRADRESGRDRDVGKAEIRERAAHEIPAGFRRTHCLVHVEVKHRAARVLSLQIILTFERLKGIVREVDGELRAVGVIGVLRRARLQDAGEALPVFLRKAVRRAFRRRRLEVVHVVRLFLEFHEARTHAPHPS